MTYATLNHLVMTIKNSRISEPTSFVGETVDDILAELVEFAERWERDWVDLPSATTKDVEKYAARVFDVPAKTITTLQLNKLPWKSFTDDWGCVNCFITEINGCDLELKHDPDKEISYLWYDTAKYSYNEPDFFDSLLGKEWRQYVLGHEINTATNLDYLDYILH